MRISDWSSDVCSSDLASGGYDLPAFANLTKFDTWANAAPPKGTLFHYPDPYGIQTKSIAGAPAPANIAFQLYNQALQTKMVVRYNQGESKIGSALGRVKVYQYV